MTTTDENTDDTTDDTITSYYVEYREPGFDNGRWIRRPKDMGSFKQAHEEFERLKEKYLVKGIDYRIRMIKTSNVVLWSTEDGDE